VTRRTVTGRFSAPAAGQRQRPAHVAPRPSDRPGPVFALGSSLGRFGLAAVLGTALAAAGQLPADALQAAPAVVSAPRTSVAPATFAAGSALTAASAAVPFERAALVAVSAPRRAAAPATSAPTAAAVKSATTVSAAARRAKAIRIAKKYVGVRYRYGGTTPSGFDCSGYTKYVWKKAGRTLPRTSRAQYAKLRKISRAKARAGDLVFFKSSSGRVYHVGIYAGKNKMYDSPRPGKRVSLRKIWSTRVSFGRV